MIDSPLNDIKPHEMHTDAIFVLSESILTPRVTSISPETIAKEQSGRDNLLNMNDRGLANICIILVLIRISDKRKNIVMYVPTIRIFWTVSLMEEDKILSTLGELIEVLVIVCFDRFPENIMPHIILDRI